MAERRNLIEGLKATPKPLPTDAEKSFVFQQDEIRQSAPRPTSKVAMVPFSTRLREDLSKALKKASLERELNGVEPFSIQDIFEDAIQSWLKTNGYR